MVAGGWAAALDTKDPVKIGFIGNFSIPNSISAKAAAMMATIASGGQAALMAPTEILAEQHFNTLRSLLARAGEKRPL
jgi:ATP-dependent DNA helicase RecG